MTSPSPPAVTYPVGRSPWLGALLALLGIAGLLANAGWAVAAPGAWLPLGLLVVPLALTAVAAWRWHAMLAGQLQWDGSAWCWNDRQPVALQAPPAVRLDLQGSLLLQVRLASGPSAWLWLDRGRAPERWHEMRRAVWSGAGAVAAAAPANGPP